MSETEHAKPEPRLAIVLDVDDLDSACLMADIEVVKKVAPELARVVPGIRMPGSSHNDQASVATPEAAIAAGASILVVGRTVTADVQALSAESPQLENALANMADRARLLAASISDL